MLTHAHRDGLQEQGDAFVIGNAGLLRPAGNRLQSERLHDVEKSNRPQPGQSRSQDGVQARIKFESSNAFVSAFHAPPPISSVPPRRRSTLATPSA